ncbi:MAG: HTH domain-containing protein [Erysipelotrichaceae bacterium]|nr:HTH domain-containing protein [Erysipelotrichaceae bacterium]
MTKYHIRNYLELFHIFIYKRVSFNELISLFHITSNTLKKDILIMEIISDCYGTELVIEDQNISYQIKDEELFKAIINECFAFYNKNIRRPRNLILRVSYIADSLINSKQPLSIETIATKLGYSRSNLRNDMRFIREIFTTYDLEIHGIPYAGIMIKGDELAKRYALNTIKLRCNTTILSDDNIDLSEFIDTRSFYIRIRNIIETTLNKYRFTFSSSEKRRLAEYIIIQLTRTHNNNYINRIENENILSLVNSEEYLIAKEIYKALDILFERNEENEILSLSVLLVVYRDYATSYLNKTIKYKEDCDLLCSDIITYLRSIWHIDLSNTLWYDVLYVWTIKVINKLKFGLLATYQYPYFGVSQKYYDYPIIAKIVFEINRILCKRFGLQIHRTQFFDISNIISLYLEEIKFDFKLPKIAISHTLGQLYNQLQYQHYQKIINPNMYESIKMIDLNSIYDDAYRRYDMIISDTNPIIHDDKKIKIFNINDELFTHTKLTNDLMDLIYIKDDVGFDKIVTLDFDCNSFNSVVDKMLELLDEYAMPTTKERTNIAEKIYNIQKYKNSISYVHYNLKNFDNILIMAKLGDNCKFEEVNLDHMFIVIFRVTLARLKFYNYLTALLAVDNNFFNDIFQDARNDNIMALVDKKIDLKQDLR